MPAGIYQRRSYTCIISAKEPTRTIMPAFPQTAAFLQMVRAANPTYSRVKTSSLAPLITILNSPNGSVNQVVAAINQIRLPPIRSMSTRRTSTRMRCIFCSAPIRFQSASG